MILESGANLHATVQRGLMNAWAFLNAGSSGPPRVTPGQTFVPLEGAEMVLGKSLDRGGRSMKSIVDRSGTNKVTTLVATLPELQGKIVYDARTRSASESRLHLPPPQEWPEEIQRSNVRYLQPISTDARSQAPVFTSQPEEWFNALREIRIETLSQASREWFILRYPVSNRQSFSVHFNHGQRDTE